MLLVIQVKFTQQSAQMYIVNICIGKFHLLQCVCYNFCTFFCDSCAISFFSLLFQVHCPWIALKFPIRSHLGPYLYWLLLGLVKSKMASLDKNVPFCSSNIYIYTQEATCNLHDASFEKKMRNCFFCQGQKIIINQGNMTVDIFMYLGTSTMYIYLYEM